MAKIGVLSHLGFGKLHGGNLRGYFLIQELLKRGHNVVVILATDRNIIDPIEKIGCEIKKINMNISRWQSTNRKMLLFPSFILKSFACIRRLNLDIVFGVCLIQALPAVLQRKAKSAVLYVDLWGKFFAYDEHEKSYCRFVSSLMDKLETWTIRKASSAWVITETMKEMLAPLVREKVVVIPDGVDTKLFVPDVDPRQVKRKYNIYDEPIIGYQGAVKRHEGLQFLAKAAPFILRKLPQAKFLIAGAGSYLKKVKEIIKLNGTEKSFIFTGWVDYFEMPQVLAATSVSVVPMPNDPATRPIISFKLLENLASGVPLVVNDLPGVREIVDENTVKFTNVEDPERFAEDIIEMLSLDKKHLLSMTNMGRKIAERLDWRKIAKLDADFIEGKPVAGQVEGLSAKTEEK